MDTPTRTEFNDTWQLLSHLKSKHPAVLDLNHVVNFAQHAVAEMEKLEQLRVQLRWLFGGTEDTESKLYKACQYAENIACSEGIMQDEERHTPQSEEGDPR